MADSNWGTEQLTRLLHDRPELQSIVKTGNKINGWLVVAFGNRSQGITIHWDGGPLSSYAQFDGESQWLNDNKNVYVRVSRYYRTGSSIGLERRPEEILFSVVFELNNVKYRQENLNIRELARAGAITQNDYVVAIAKCEYQALQETGEFYRNIWTPFCVEAGFNSDPKIWITARDVTFDNWISQYPPNFYYPWRFYGAQYNEIRQSKSDKEEVSAVDYNNLGLTEVSAGNENRAIDNFSKAVALNPTFNQAYFNRALARYNMGDFDGAIADASQSIKLNPNNAGAFNTRGNAEMKKGQFNEALNDYNQAISISPKFFEAYYNRGILRTKMTNLDGAYEDYSIAINISPKDFRAYEKRGTIERIRGNLAGAFSDYNKALFINPNEPSVYADFGYAKYESGDLSDSLGYFNKSVYLKPDGLYERMFVWILEYAINGTIADINLRTFIDSHSSNVNIWELDLAHFLLGELSQEDLMQKACSKDATKTNRQMCEAYFYIGTKQYLIGNRKAALSSFQNCVNTGQKDNVEYQIAQFKLKQWKVSPER